MRGLEKPQILGRLGLTWRWKFIKKRKTQKDKNVKIKGLEKATNLKKTFGLTWTLSKQSSV